MIQVKAILLSAALATMAAAGAYSTGWLVGVCLIVIIVIGYSISLTKIDTHENH